MNTIVKGQKHNITYSTTVELLVPSELYGKTVCVVDKKSFLNGNRIFPCADGCDYELKGKIIKNIEKAFGIKGATK